MNLKWWDQIAFWIHFAQAVTLMGLAIAYPGDTTNVINSYVVGRPGAADAVTYTTTLVVHPVAMSSAFEFMSALAHLWLWRFVKKEEFRKMQERNHNPYRWAEYAVSSTLMLIDIASLCGVNSLATLIAISGCNVAMILFGDAGDRILYGQQEDDPQVSWNKKVCFGYGCIVGIAPWIVIAVQVAQAAIRGNVPVFVWGIIGSIFGLFSCFALIEYRKIFKGASFEDTEWRYRVASIVAKSSLSWQAFPAMHRF